MIKQIQPLTLFIVMTAIGVSPFVMLYSLGKIYLCFVLAFVLALGFGLVKVGLQMWLFYSVFTLASYFIHTYAKASTDSFAAFVTLFEYMLQFILMVMPIIMVGQIIVYKVNSCLLVASFKKLKLPRGIILAIGVAFRYLPTIKHEMACIKDSMDMRGLGLRPINILTKPLKTFEYALVPLLFRSIKIAEELSASALTRGWEHDGEHSCYVDCRFGKADFLVILYILAGLSFIHYTTLPNLWPF